jgi:hypothetical protein
MVNATCADVNLCKEVKTSVRMQEVKYDCAKQFCLTKYLVNEWFSQTKQDYS